MNRRRPAVTSLKYLALVTYLIFLAFPLFWLISTSLKTPQEIALIDPTMIPREITFDNFTTAFSEQPIVRSILNTTLVAGASCVLTVLLSIPAAYVMARYRSTLSRATLVWVLLSQIFPFILVIIPLFLLLRDFGLYDTYIGLITVYVVWSMPFALWMLRSYVATIPYELEEAASMDGASKARTIKDIVAPLLAPGVVAAGLFAFVSAWNEFMFALVLIRSPEQQTLSLTLVKFIGAEGVARLGPLAAASLVATVPSLIFFAIMQRRLTGGLLGGAVKS
ncbi:multiple sugar transport system permease protein [Haloactinopolyspora alba]|uniref:Multiple sugar transport system permease protein n=1 Tax=Haloactinopolyspora alba TaxID=648780 RepID=A0A2P8E9L5_9ACTN|nr:carbohydrate ABC transporter permease [Haloactinopolyspora alba]PSL06145.1 multiple sugar transport system permease protein [Haloactinopolyspora alba]